MPRRRFARGRLAAGLDFRWASASVSSALCEMTTHAAIRFVAGESASASGDVACAGSAAIDACAQAETRRPVRVRARYGCLGAGYSAQAPASEDEPSAHARPEAGRRGWHARQSLAGRATYVVGRVIDLAGKAIAGVPIEIIGRPREPWLPARVTANADFCSVEACQPPTVTFASKRGARRRLVSSRRMCWPRLPDSVSGGPS